MGRTGQASAGLERISTRSKASARSFDLEHLRHLVDRGYLLERRHPEADLHLFNYTNLAQYEDRWEWPLGACRGLILGSRGEVVARPFPKFFNYGQKHAATGGEWTATEKFDGSLGIVYPLGEELAVATRGSFESPEAVAATELLSTYELDYVPGRTPLLEIILPESRKVVDYGARRELVLLASIDNRTGLDSELPAWSGPVAKEMRPGELGVSSLEELLSREQENAEGWVARFGDGERVKLKHRRYIRLHRVLYGPNEKAVWDALRMGDDPVRSLDGLADEDFSLVENMAARLQQRRDAMFEQAGRELRSLPDGLDRRQTAEFFAGCSTPAGILFAMLDGRDPSDRIWNEIRPT